MAMRLYGMSSSGNCYKLQLACAQLGVAHEWHEIDITRGENLSPEFLAGLNDRGKVPVLQLDDGRTMSESNAILHYLADGSALLPEDRWERAKTLQVKVPAGPTLKSGMKGERVALLRERLGLAPGDAFDAALAARVKAFQAVHGLKDDGVAGAGTIDALNRGSNGGPDGAPPPRGETGPRHEG